MLADIGFVMVEVAVIWYIAIDFIEILGDNNWWT